jgi:two-component system CheB/CheR fusion protein
VQDRNDRWYSMRVRPYTTPEGKADGAVLVLMDITDRKNSEAILVRSDQRKNEFLAILGHELRSPLAPIRHAVSLMKGAAADPQRLLQVQDVLERQVGQMVRIVEDLLDLTRTVEKKIVLRAERIELATALKSSTEATRGFMESRHHELVVSVPVDPIWLDADPVRLTQVFTNLLHNAAKFTDAGGRIRFLAEVDAERKNVKITVADNGIGISPQLLPHIFEMFTQGDRSLEQGHGGLGIGLTLVKRLVELHGGTVEARSGGSGEGSEFIVILPLARTQAPGRKREQTKDSAKLEKSALPRRVLVIDDNEDQAEMLRQILVMMGHTVFVAHDGVNALEMAIKTVPDAALVDIGLPGMDGYELARRIRQIPALHRVLLIAQTGWGQDDDRRRSREAGFDHHFVKPMAVKDMQDVIASPPRAE